MSIKTRCPPELAERFQVTRALGEGGMGAVFLGSQPGLDRPIALKVLRADRTEGENIGRFQREAKAMAAVEHPHMVRLIDYGVEAGQYYLVMEYVEGLTLAHRIHKNGGLDPEETREILMPVAEALQAMHDVGIIHRDIKPDNVMLAREGRVLLMDLGLARFKRRGLTATGTGRIVGTIEYMAPEMLRGEKLTPAADWYSWGITVYETLTGDVPWDRDRILEAASEYDQPWLLPPPPPGVDPDSAMAQLAAWCLRGDRDRRPVKLKQLSLVLDGEVSAPKARWEGEKPAPDETFALNRGDLEDSSWPGAGPLLGTLMLVLIALVGGYTLGGPGSARPRLGHEVRVFTDGQGAVGARWVRPGEGSLDLELLPLSSDETRTLPVSQGVPQTVPMDEAFQARLIFPGGSRGEWRGFPAPRKSSVRWLGHELSPDGALVLGEGAPPPEGTRAVLPGGETVPLQVGDSLAGVWSAVVELRDTAPQEEVVLEGPPSAALPLWTRVQLPPLAGPTGELTAFLRDLERRPAFVKGDSDSPRARELRRRWLRLRCFALPGWRTLPREVRETFASALEILVSQEQARERWSNASTFPLDLEANRPGEGTALLRRLRTSGLLEEKAVEKLFDRPNTVVRLLRKISTGLRGRRLVGVEDLARELLGTDRPVDPAFLASCFREAFLPSPYVEETPERWIAWAAWSSRVRPALVKGHTLGGKAYQSMIHDFGRKTFGEFMVHEWLPNREYPGLPDPVLSGYEDARAWAAVQAAPAASRADLAWVYVVCLLPRPGIPVEPRILENILSGLEPLTGKDDLTLFRRLLLRRTEGHGGAALKPEHRTRIEALGRPGAR